MGPEPEPERTPEIAALKRMGDEVGDFFDAIYAEAERGCVLLAQSYMDHAIEEILRGRLKKLSGVNDSELDALFKPTQPLGSFLVRARLCRAMGILDHNTLKMLTTLAKLRNEFAHEPSPATLTDARVAAIVDRLSDESKKTVSRHADWAVEAKRVIGEVVKQTGVNPSVSIPSEARMKFMVAATFLFSFIKLAGDMPG